MPAERITLHRTNVDKTEVIEQYPKTIAGQVYDLENDQFLDTTLVDIKSKLNNIRIDVTKPPYNVRFDTLEDMPKIQQAINDITSGELYFPRGRYLFARSTNEILVALDFIEKNGLSIIGDDAEFYAEVDVTTANFSLLRFLGCQNLKIKGIRFNVRVTGIPTVRRNARILNITTNPESISVSQNTLIDSENILIEDNYFKITHTGYTDLNFPALYGVHAHTPESGILRKVRNINFNNNVFEDSDGRLFMTYLVDGVNVTNNRFYNCAPINMAYVIRLIGATKNAYVSNNFIETSEGIAGSVGPVHAFLATGGLTGTSLTEVIQAENITFINNTLRAKGRPNNISPIGLYFSGVNLINFKSNTLILEDGPNTNRGEAIRLIDNTNGISSGSVVIKDNELYGWKTWFIRNDEAEVDTFIAENNNFFGDTASNQFFDPNNKIIRSKNRSQFLNRDTESNRGVFIFSGDNSSTSVVIPHGLGRSPSRITVSERNNATGFASIKYYFGTSTGINVYFNTAPPNGTENISLTWYAEI